MLGYKHMFSQTQRYSLTPPPPLFFMANFVILSKLKRNWGCIEKCGGGMEPLNVFIYEIKYTKSVAFRLS
jgi:hypothetical protein